jgi:hypothetical protein
MAINHVPALSTDNPTGCCPRFVPGPWHNQTFIFKNKPFVKALSRSFFHMPINLGSVIAKTWAAIIAAKADDKTEFVMLSYDVSPWKCEHYFSAKKAVPGLENVKLSGEFMSRVYEGAFQCAPNWIKDMKGYVESKGKQVDKVYLYYTTCPKCLKVYGNNYVVALAKLAD